MKKPLKKFLSRLMPKGRLKSKIKLAYYNASAKSGTSFSIEPGATDVYLTKYEGLHFKTVDPLYVVAEDFDFYLHFHKVKKGEVIMDAGANNGYISILFSKLTGAEGKVYAFEPDSININHIKENIALDTSLDKNIVIQDLLLWNENTTIDF